MKIFNKTNVVEEAKERIRWLYSEYDDLVVSMSGGKDSTVIFHLVLEVAKELNKLPIKVFWIDQEFEWTHTYEYMKHIMNRDDVKPYWLQVPFKLVNTATTISEDNLFFAWDENRDLVRPKEDIAIKENIFGTDRFYELFTKWHQHTFKDMRIAKIGGVRAEENPKRLMAISQGLTYKHISWGKRIDENHNIFYPIYDMTYKDVWKYIYENNIRYNPIYDLMYSRGLQPRYLRVSSLIHEISVKDAMFMSEIDNEMWEQCLKHIPGYHSIKQLDFNELIPKKLPYMFKDWVEYKDYLADNLLNGKSREKVKNKFKLLDKYFFIIGDEIGYFKRCVKTIIINDTDEFMTLENFRKSPHAIVYLRWLKTKQFRKGAKKYNKWIDIYVQKWKKSNNK